MPDPQPPPGLLPLDDQLCFALHDASRAIAACYRPLLAEIDLTYSQYLVMLVLWETPADRTVTMKVLCERLSLNTATLSPLVQRLERLGHLTRRRSVRDERSVEVAATPSGQALYAAAVAAQRRVERATATPPAELAALRADVQRLTARLRAAGNCVDQPVDQPADQPVDQPVDQPAGRPLRVAPGA